MFLLLALMLIAGGALFTYLYDEGAPLVSRLCAGACLGFAAFGLVAFVFASFLGLTTITLVLATAAVVLPPALLLGTSGRARVLEDIKAAARDSRRAVLYPSLGTGLRFLFYAAIALVLWLVFERAMFERADGVYTGLLNNYGDLPFHLSVITSFVKGANFPPEDPTYAGASFTYPFVADFIAACFVRAGASLRVAMLLENFVLTMALAGLVYRWALLLTRERAAAQLSIVLVFLSGGLGWWLLFTDARELNNQGFVTLLKQLPHDYTIMPESAYRWGNALTTLLVPQRGMLLGLPLALLVFIQWWQSSEVETGGEKLKEGKRKNRKAKRAVQDKPEEARARISFLNFPGARRMIAAGAIAGLLPLVHAHSFAVVMMVGTVLALIQGTRRWRAWAAFFIVALLLAGPQMWWATRGSSVHAGTFFAWQVGWDRGGRNVLWFWFLNTGLFIPLLALSILWRGKRAVVPTRLLLFYLPFTLCFLIPNLFKLAPWVWDNIKVLFYWYVASVPLVALLLVRMWRGPFWMRSVAAPLVVALTLAGALDVWRVVSGTVELQEFDRNGVAFAAMMERVTPQRALVLHAPIHNHPVFLTGRRSLMGYPGHIWTHGLDYIEREEEIRRIYAGASTAPALMSRYGVDYVVVSPLERQQMPVNDNFFERFERVGETGEYRLYKIKRP
jgi:hypothetical protein